MSLNNKIKKYFEESINPQNQEFGSIKEHRDWWAKSEREVTNPKNRTFKSIQEHRDWWARTEREATNPKNKNDDYLKLL